jgi:hypothetical protein
MTPLILAALLAASGPSGSQVLGSEAATVSPPPAPPVKTPRNDLDKPICRLEDKVGSRVQVRVCKTQAEWDAQDRALDRFFHDARDYGAQQTGVSRGGPM